MSLGSLFTIVALFIAVLCIAGAGFLFYTRGRGKDIPRLFAPRMRRLAFIERAYLDGGRKLVLVRRDNVEHLIMIGGPIDLVVETGIPAEAYQGVAEDKDEYAYRDGAVWQRPAEPLASGKAPEASHRPETRPASGVTPEPARPQLSLTPGGKNDESDLLELTPYQ